MGSPSKCRLNPGLGWSAVVRPRFHRTDGKTSHGVSSSNLNVVISPFDTSSNANPNESEDDSDDELPLTLENVEKVLDEMRPYLQSDG